MYDFGKTALPICSGYSHHTNVVETALPICSGYSHNTNVVARPPFLGLSLEVHNAGVSQFRLKK